MVQGEISIVPIANGGDSIMSIGLAATFDAIRKTSDMKATFSALGTDQGRRCQCLTGGSKSGALVGRAGSGA